MTFGTVTPFQRLATNVEKAGRQLHLASDGRRLTRLAVREPGQFKRAPRGGREFELGREVCAVMVVDGDVQGAAKRLAGEQG